MNRLHPKQLHKLTKSVRTSSYDRSSIKPGILHLGLGAFHRAHQAVFIEKAIEQSGGNWGIIGVSLRSDTVSRQLLPQQCLYSVLSQDTSNNTIQLVSAIQDIIVAPDEPGRLLTTIANPEIKIITLTITEKAYCLASDGRSLDTENSIIREDLASPQSPKSAIGLLARGLVIRAQESAAPITIISCDNLSENSNRLRRVLSDYLAHYSPETLPWLKDCVSFPCSMVDRIVPAMDSEKIHRQSELLGLIDEAAVTTEPFKQWIIEDKFSTATPDWASAGVQLVEDIRPFEEIKLRLLNASHSAIAYTGLLCGKETVADVMADADLRNFVEKLMSQELIPLLTVPSGFDILNYKNQLLQRFDNSSLRHRCSQIAMDGSEKIAQRWLPTLAEKADCPLLITALSVWCYYILNTKMKIDDPRSKQLTQVRESNSNTREKIIKLIAVARINRESIQGFDLLCDRLLSNFDELISAGVLNSIKKIG